MGQAKKAAKYLAENITAKSKELTELIDTRNSRKYQIFELKQHMNELIQSRLKLEREKIIRGELENSHYIITD